MIRREICPKEEGWTRSWGFAGRYVKSFK